MAEEKKKKTLSWAREERNFRILYALIYPIFHLLFPFRTYHRERIPDGPCIVCSNHSSNADPPMVCFALTRKHPLHIMAKKSLLEIPIMGPILHCIGTFPVDRGSNDLTAIKNAMRVVREGRKLLLFPEGTRVAEGEEASAKTGAAMLAMRTGAPVLPVFTTRKKRMFHRSVAIIGEPYTIRPAGKRATKEEYAAAADEMMRRIYALEEEMP